MPKLLHYFQIIFLTFCLFFFLFHPVHAQIDTDATEKTKFLYDNLKQVQNSNSFMFGQEFYNSFRYNSGSAHDEKTYSDSKEVTGAHPAVLGSDFHYYIEKNETERSYHTEAVKYAYQQGAVITFDWHLSGRGTTTYEYQESTKDLVNNIIQDLNGDRDWYFGELDKAIEIINNDLVVNEERIPIVFRPLHDYFKVRTNSILFCWSPNTPMTYFPGDEYVDVLGVDAYEVTAADIRSQLAIVVDHAQENGKVVVFAETGNRTNTGTSPGDDAANYWKNTILPAVKDDPSGKAEKIAWVLTWINSSWSYPYVPHSLSTQSAKENFIDFKNSPYVLFLDEIPNMYIEAEVALAIDDDDRFQEEIMIFPIPAYQYLTVHLKNPAPVSIINIYNFNGKKLYEENLEGKETIIDVKNILKPGIYFLKFQLLKTLSTKK